MSLQNLFGRLFPQPLATLERRLHRRAVNYWQSVRSDGDLVILADFDPLAIEDDSSHGFMLDVRDPACPKLTYVGPVLEQEAEIGRTDIPLSTVKANSLLARFANHYPRVLESQSPETAEYDFVTHAGYHILCRGALLPLSSDGKDVDHVFGVVSWKSERAAN